MHVEKAFLGPDFDLNNGVKGVPVRNQQMRSILSPSWRIMEDSTYRLGLYADFSWPFGEDELVVIVLAIIRSFGLMTRSSGSFEVGSGDGSHVVWCGVFSDLILHKLIKHLVLIKSLTAYHLMF